MLGFAFLEILRHIFHELQELRTMSTSIQAQLDALTAAQAQVVTTFQTVSDGITKEIQQLATAITSGGFTPAQTAQLQGSIDALTNLNASMQSAVSALAADDT